MGGTVKDKSFKSSFLLNRKIYQNKGLIKEKSYLVRIFTDIFFVQLVHWLKKGGRLSNSLSKEWLTMGMYTGKWSQLPGKMCCLMICFIHGEQASKLWREETQIQVLVSKGKKHTGGGGRPPPHRPPELLFCLFDLICLFYCILLFSETFNMLF